LLNGNIGVFVLDIML